MADKKPGRGGHGAPKKKGKKPPTPPEPTSIGRKSSKRDRSPVRNRLYDGKTAIPVQYSGSTRHGSYMAAMVGGSMVRDGSGEPIPYHDLPLEPKAPSDF